MKDDLISRKAAIDAINTWDKFGVDERGRLVRWHEGLELYVHLRDVLTAIINLPSKQPETHGKRTETHACVCISREAAIDAIKALWNNAPSAQHVSAMFDCEDAIRALPSAQTDIIYCKDCKFYSPMNRETKTGICNLTMHQNFGDNWFCAGAERRTDE